MQDKHFILKLSLLLIILSDTYNCWHLWRQNTAVLRVYKFYVAIYCTWQSIWKCQILKTTL